MNPHVIAIAGRFSLRPPQRESLEILAKPCDLIPWRRTSIPPYLPLEAQRFLRFVASLPISVGELRRQDA
jgi:hypothetical protein